jgi:two-component system, chemotaxis family, response regulator Rcp1
MTRRTQPNVLLVEDNPGDVRLLREVLTGDVEGGGSRATLHVVPDGEQALTYLAQEDQRPDLILLDLNLPGMSGKEVLDQIKADSDLLTIPVLILTSSSAPSDISDCYERHANCYLVKPKGYADLVELGRALEEFWLSRVEPCPPNPNRRAR